MKAFKTVYVLIGVILVAGVWLTSMRGLSQEDMELYEAARSLEDGRSESVWPGLRISDYPVALRKRNTEYVLFEGNTEKRRPVLPVIACTAYPVDDRVNVLMPCKSEMDSLGQIVEGFSLGAEDFLINQFSIESKRMSENQYIAFLYHEALHAFQLSTYEQQIMGMVGDWDETEIESMIAELEADPAVQSLYERQAELLYRLVISDNEMVDADGIYEYIAARKEILDMLRSNAGAQKGEMISKYINFTELLEGTARYAEVKTALMLSDNTLYEQYLSSLKETMPGREKYYRSGMGICLLLDRMSPGWKDELSISTLTLTQILENSVGVSENGGNKVYDSAG